MDYIDLIQMAFSNLWRTRLRSSLTILGVVIGIAALSSMISFGVGMQKNLTDAFKKNDLFSSLNVTAKEISLNDMSSGDMASIEEKLQKPTTILNDSVVEMIKNIPGVKVAFPEIKFPVKLRYRNKETNLNLMAMPTGMKAFYPFNELKTGAFFTSDTAWQLLLSEKTLKKLGFTLKTDINDTTSFSGKYACILPDSLLSSRIEIISKDIDLSGIIANPFMAMMREPALPFKDTSMTFEIQGVFSENEGFGFSRFNNGLIVPIETSKKIPRLGFENVWDLLGNKNNNKSYTSIYVRVNDMKETKAVTDLLKQKGLNVFAFSEELKEIKRVFMIMDSLLGAVGLIALVVAALGIINTMLMSILERTREIGIMKSIGGSEGEIKILFFAEAASIGLIGAIFGLGLGWLVTRVANVIMNSQLKPQDLPDVDLFSFPVWLILGATGFSVLISLAAGLYPAARAARVDPVKALRHD
ncbi:MAG: FtsX-like permease family protein [Bacteroidales bacterium]